MPDATDVQNVNATPSESLPTSSEGYTIHFTVKPEGFEISDPQPLAPQPQMSELQQDTIPKEEKSSGLVPDLATALKHVMAVIEKFPMSQSVEKGFERGFNDK